MATERLDEQRLAFLVNDAQQRQDFSNPELGSMIDHICRTVLNMPDYRKWDECVQMEMYGSGALAAIKAISKNADSTNVSLFDYLYTTVKNEYGHVLEKMFRAPVTMDSNALETMPVFEPTYIRERRRRAKGLLEKNKEKILEAAISRKQTLLRNVINRASRAFAEMLDQSQLEELIGLARKAREAIC